MERSTLDPKDLETVDAVFTRVYVTIPLLCLLDSLKLFYILD